MPHLLIVEDERDLSRLIARAFTREGFTVTEAATGRAAREAVAAPRPGPASWDRRTQGGGAGAARMPACVLLDLMLPDISGLELCRELKGNPRTRAIPVIMVTARSEEVDRVVGFELGADDYVPKPFSPRELVLRVKAILRRIAGGAGTAGPAPAGPLVWGPLILDETGHRVTVAGRDIPLTALEFKLLAQLMRLPGQVQTRDALLDRVWGYTAGVTTRTLDTHVKRLRNKLAAARPAVETVRGIGYRLAAEGRRASPPR